MTERPRRFFGPRVHKRLANALDFSYILEVAMAISAANHANRRNQSTGMSNSGRNSKTFRPGGR